MPGGEVRELGFDYDVEATLSKEDLREILINLGREFLNTIDSDEAVRPYLTKYPFVMNNVQITLFLKDSKL
jgi:hypothetical protein